jgi:hypothetical protein
LPYNINCAINKSANSDEIHLFESPLIVLKAMNKHPNWNCIAINDAKALKTGWTDQFYNKQVIVTYSKRKKLLSDCIIQQLKSVSKIKITQKTLGENYSVLIHDSISCDTKAPLNPKPIWKIYGKPTPTHGWRLQNGRKKL